MNAVTVIVITNDDITIDILNMNKELQKVFIVSSLNSYVV